MDPRKAGNMRQGAGEEAGVMCAREAPNRMGPLGITWE